MSLLFFIVFRTPYLPRQRQTLRRLPKGFSELPLAVQHMQHIYFNSGALSPCPHSPGLPRRYLIVALYHYLLCRLQVFCASCSGLRKLDTWIIDT